MRSLLRIQLFVLTAATFLLPPCGFAQQTNQPYSHTNFLSNNKLMLRLMRARLKRDYSSLSPDERLRRETMINLYEVPECVDYLTEVSSTISQKCSACDSASCPSDTKIDAKFVLHQDGKITDITVSGNINAPVAPLLIQAIKGCPVFKPWPDKMRSIIGKDSYEMGIHFGFNMTPPSPN